jgi:hypothetical protein
MTDPIDRMHDYDDSLAEQVRRAVMRHRRLETAVLGPRRRPLLCSPSGPVAPDDQPVLHLHLP